MQYHHSTSKKLNTRTTRSSVV